MFSGGIERDQRHWWVKWHEKLFWTYHFCVVIDGCIGATDEISDTKIDNIFRTIALLLGWICKFQKPVYISVLKSSVAKSWQVSQKKFSCDWLCSKDISLQFHCKRTSFQLFFSEFSKPTDIYLFKLNNGETRKVCSVYSKLIIKTSELRQWRHFGFFFVNYEQIWHIVLVVPLLTLNKYLLVSWEMFSKVM